MVVFNCTFIICLVSLTVVPSNESQEEMQIGSKTKQVAKINNKKYFFNLYFHLQNPFPSMLLAHVSPLFTHSSGLLNKVFHLTNGAKFPCDICTNVRQRSHFHSDQKTFPKHWAVSLHPLGEKPHIVQILKISASNICTALYRRLHKLNIYHQNIIKSN